MENFIQHPNDPILKSIKGFYSSSSDLLYLSGDKGCGKSELAYKSLLKLDEDFLIFQHICFKQSAIDDFLLNFYDTLREYALSGKIVLKKSLDENFAQKVSYYFKNLDKKSVVLIDNYEEVQDDPEIFNFLAHLASYSNVKLVVLSRYVQIKPFIEKGLKVESLKIENNSLETFKQKVLFSLHSAQNNDIKALYENTKGYELYLRMSLNYIMTVGITLKDFMQEFLNRKKSFEEFLILKIISLVPEVYFKLLQNLSAINHVVSVDFIEKYNLGEKKQVEYLTQKLVLTKTHQGVYLKDYLRSHFLNTLSVQDKIQNAKMLIEIYENELSKSPKDRTLRLSRESIRKQINSIREITPHVNRESISRQDFSYAPHVQNITAPWMKMGQIPKPPENREIKPSKKMGQKEESLLKKLENLNEIENSSVNANNETFDAMLEKVEELEKTFDYQKTLLVLGEMGKIAQKKEEKELVLKKLAQNYIRINNFEYAIDIYNTLLEHYREYKETKKYTKLELKVAQVFKSLYRFEKARFHYEQVLKSKDKAFIAKAFLGLAEISESEHSPKKAIGFYENALEQNDIESTSEAYFKMGLMYDDGQNVEIALSYYKKCIETSKEPKKNKFLAQSYSNIALIHFEQDEQKEAIEFFNLAIAEDEKNKNTSGVYFNTNKLAQIYKSLDNELAFSYLKEALVCAKEMNDNFKIAFSYVDMGDIYYSTKQNLLALQSYLEAKNILKENISEENRAKIDLRINDMRIKMEQEEFEQTLRGYGF